MLDRPSPPSGLFSAPDTRAKTSFAPTEMLTSAHSIVRFEQGRAIPDRLTRQRHAQYGPLAERMLAVYRSGIGRTRRELRQSVENLLADEPDCNPRRVASFCKLLDDAGDFDAD